MANVAQHLTEKPISVRLTADDRPLLELAARLDGMRLSTFLRHAAIERARARVLRQGEVGSLDELEATIQAGAGAKPPAHRRAHHREGA